MVFINLLFSLDHICYGLNGLCPPKAHADVLIPSVMVSRDEAFGRQLGLEEVARVETCQEMKGP